MEIAWRCGRRCLEWTMGTIGVSDCAIMPKYVALLRAINVGGHTVKMEYLRGLFEASGFANVETFIAAATSSSSRDPATHGLWSKRSKSIYKKLLVMK